MSESSVAIVIVGRLGSNRYDGTVGVDGLNTFSLSFCSRSRNRVLSAITFDFVLDIR